MIKSLELLKNAVERLQIKQQKFMIRPNDIFWTPNGDMMVQDGKEWIWTMVMEEVELIIREKRNEKLNTILNERETIESRKGISNGEYSYLDHSVD